MCQKSVISHEQLARDHKIWCSDVSIKPSSGMDTDVILDGKLGLFVFNSIRYKPFLILR